MGVSKTIEERFMAKVVFIPEHACWEWIGSQMKPMNNSRGGYGQISKDGRLKLAHRASYELFVGEIPDGLDIDHLCRNRACVNPKHLEPVTRKENLERCPFLIARRANPYCSKGHLYTEENTAIYNGTTRRCRECCRIRARKNYKYVRKNVSKI